MRMMASLNNTAATTTTRYKSSIPPNVEIAKTKPVFAKIQEANLGALLYAENGGYYVKHPEGKVCAVASDRLYSILDDSHMSLIFHLERDGLHEKAEQVMRDLLEVGVDVDRLKRDTSDEIRSGACVKDPGLDEDADDDIQQPKARS